MMACLVSTQNGFSPTVVNKGEEEWLEIIELFERNKEDNLVAMTVEKEGLNPDIEARMFGISSYLLVSDDNVLFTFDDQSYESTKYMSYYPEYGIDLGSALGSYSLENGLYVRKFMKGIVLVNPSSSESFDYVLDGVYDKVVPVGGGIVGEDGTYEGYLEYEEVSGSLEVGPVEGIVLLSS